MKEADAHADEEHGHGETEEAHAEDEALTKRCLP